MFCCSTCGREAYLIRNVCRDCDPSLHESRAAARKIVGVAADEFKAATGHEVLAYWNEFESWVVAHGGWDSFSLDQQESGS